MYNFTKIILTNIKRFLQFDCKNPIQLQRRSTKAAFMQIPNNLQATKPNSLVESFA